MKQLAILLTLTVLMIFSCKKSTTTASNPVNPSNPSTSKTVYYDMKYWVDDTLYAVQPPYDTMYAMTIAGKNYVKYKGVQYAIKAYVMEGDTYSDSDGHYIIEMWDMAGNWITSKDSIDIGVQAITSRMYDKPYSKWDTMPQTFYPPHKPPFPSTVIGYLSDKKR